MTRKKRPKKFKNNPKDHAKLRRRWRAWLLTLVSDMTALLGKREIFLELQDIARVNPKILNPGAFFNWMCTNYINTVTVGVRRFTDQDNRSRSLWRMLYEILENPGVINRRAHKALYRGMPINLSDSTFNNVVGRGKEFLSQPQVRSDLMLIEETEERIRRFVNKRIAHFTSPGEIRRLPTFDELHRTLNVLDKLLCKYNLLLTASGMSTSFATRQYDWQEVLRKPWIREVLEDY